MSSRVLMFLSIALFTSVCSCSRTGEQSSMENPPAASREVPAGAHATAGSPDASNGLVSICDTLLVVVEKEGIEAAVARYRDLREHHVDGFDFSESELNRLGYRLLGRRQIKDAIEIFTLNVEMFPESANVYDSLGEGYLADGEFGLAVENYRKSLEINPDNRIARAIVRKYGRE
ncbi:MAG TPA: tetratricopeptide repeat protein [Patescibacteria group bacterium]|nr:tetratricopeptide repeat protein [Patescibacteria group bacterium]